MNFRREALEALKAPEDLDAPIRLVRPRAWALLVALALLVSCTAAWSVTGTLPRKVKVPGILTHPLGVSRVQSPQTGLVSNLFVDSATLVPKGTPVLSVVDQQGATQIVRAPFAGRVIGLLVSSGQYISAGTTFMTVERTDANDDRLLATLFVSPRSAGMLRQGGQVDVSVQSAPSQAFGLLRGRITAIDQFPYTEQQVADFLGGNQQAAARLMSNGSVVRITVDLDTDPRTLSGYRWSNKAGPPFRIDSQTPVTGFARLPGESPIDWLLPG
ncbi:HlyD family efflux transporter periplasmic adaptor subunit [Streptomyces sp. SID3343]|uniref:HlyD family efflux transporter periplasmic adaptor subunit n=1 Tax=Streptomyces sp. SID3343 TaxID=2690260 RepID=UPI00136E8EF1|nr:HlyD family efflux transporter periplasmic adaptor subunit [Streptomyces sp. SID3343]MYW03572.1 HlyD family efflux transporter periplasmic adaptor subunit [Streptomyces sp. SID3343]